MSELIDTTEMYLRTIYELHEEGEVPRRARITERLGHSGPTVSQTVARMERDGLVVVTPERHLELTPAGRERAITVMRRHRLAELLLVHVLDLEVEHVHEEACRLEHVLTTRVERKILALLPDVTTSPYGNPIPGLKELLEGADDAEAFRGDLLPLTDVDSGALVTVRRIGEPAQREAAILAALQSAALLPGEMCSVTKVADTSIEAVKGVTALPDDLVLTAKSRKKQAVRVPAELAAHIFVQPAP